MKKIAILTLIILIHFSSFANNKDSVIYYYLPDSIKTISFLVESSVSSLNDPKEFAFGIQTSIVKLSLEIEKGKRKIVYEYPSVAKVMSKGVDVSTGKGEMTWNYEWAENERYKFMISNAGDSAGNFILYSGYIFLPRENKWKLIGTCKIDGQWGYIHMPAILHNKAKKSPVRINFSELWCQRNNGSWKNLLADNKPNPVINLLSHVDSLRQIVIDKTTIDQAIANGKIDARQQYEDIYYTIMKDGTGRNVTLNDTVVVNYKGSLLSDGSIFDQTKDKPATFPLNRLIVGWQIGLPLCKIGGKIKIVIPSGLAYSVRTRSSMIPPNSILVFEVEILDAKAPL